MRDLMPLAEALAARLKARGESIAISESSAGGLISASLVAVPGASNYYLGGATVYTLASRRGLLAIEDADMAGMRASTEAYALLTAKRIRSRLGADWGLSETGASGPTGNRYGDASGHACLAAVGTIEVARTLETGSTDRAANMRIFAETALRLLLEAIDGLPAEA